MLIRKLSTFLSILVVGFGLCSVSAFAQSEEKSGGDRRDFSGPDLSLSVSPFVFSAVILLEPVFKPGWIPGTPRLPWIRP